VASKGRVGAGGLCRSRGSSRRGSRGEWTGRTDWHLVGGEQGAQKRVKECGGLQSHHFLAGQYCAWAKWGRGQVTAEEPGKSLEHQQGKKVKEVDTVRRIGRGSHSRKGCRTGKRGVASNSAVGAPRWGTRAGGGENKAAMGGKVVGSRCIDDRGDGGKNCVASGGWKSAA